MSFKVSSMPIPFQVNLFHKSKRKLSPSACQESILRPISLKTPGEGTVKRVETKYLKKSFELQNLPICFISFLPFLSPTSSTVVNDTTQGFQWTVKKANPPLCLCKMFPQDWYRPTLSDIPLQHATTNAFSSKGVINRLPTFCLKRTMNSTVSCLACV